LVKGVTPALLFGNDRNRNGILDADEDDGSGTLDRGWSAYLTVFSREQNVDSTGQPRVYINDQDLNSLYDKLNTAVGGDLTNYIMAYRTYGPAQVSNSGQKGGFGAPGGTSGMGSGTSGGATGTSGGTSGGSSGTNQQSTGVM